MKKLSTDIEAIIFDLDGTLWDPGAFVSRGWQIAVNSRYPHLRSEITAEEMKSCMGMPIDLIGEKLFPALSSAERKVLVDECLDAEHRELKTAGEELLFPAVRQTLQQLSLRYKLAIASNCETGYIENFLERCGLAELFCDFESWGRTGRSKGENIQLLMERNLWQHACMVGDTELDQDAAAYAGIPFVFARYGFGNVHAYAYAIDRFEDLPALLAAKEQW